MRTRICFCDIQKENYDLYFTVNTPDVCPHCSAPYKSIGYDINSYYIRFPDDSVHFYSDYLCTYCYKVFIAHYFSSYIGDNDENCVYAPTELIPHSNVEAKFPENIINEYERYCKVYNQAFLAEQAGLLEISGMGYRKALEILIKSCAIKFHPDKERNISKMSLHDCIEKYIDDERIKEISLEATWLGNNEVHYERLYSSLDVQDMKQFITSVQSLIDCDINFEKARTNRNDRRSQNSTST
jgi:hypothetical protein